MNEKPAVRTYPNLEAMLNGRVAGSHTEWPALRAELRCLLNGIYALFDDEGNFREQHQDQASVTLEAVEVLLKVPTSPSSNEGTGGSAIADIERAIDDIEFAWREMATTGTVVFANSDDTLQYNAKERIKKAVASMKHSAKRSICPKCGEAL